MRNRVRVASKCRFPLQRKTSRPTVKSVQDQCLIKLTLYSLQWKTGQKGPKQSSKTVGCEIYPHVSWQMNNQKLNPDRKFIAESTMKQGQDGHEYKNFPNIREKT